MSNALSIYQEIKDLSSQADALDALGELCCTSGKYQEAINYHERALILRRRMVNQRGFEVACTNTHLAYAYLGTEQNMQNSDADTEDASQQPDRIQRAEEIFNENLRYFKSEDINPGLIKTYNGLGMVNVIQLKREIGKQSSNDDNGYHERIINYYRRSESYFQQAISKVNESSQNSENTFYRDYEGEVEALSGLGYLNFLFSQYSTTIDNIPAARNAENRASENYEEASRSKISEDGPQQHCRLAAEVNLGLGKVYYQQGKLALDKNRIKEAIGRYNVALELYQRLGHFLKEKSAQRNLYDAHSEVASVILNGLKNDFQTLEESFAEDNANGIASNLDEVFFHIDEACKYRVLIKSNNSADQFNEICDQVKEYYLNLGNRFRENKLFKAAIRNHYKSWLSDRKLTNDQRSTFYAIAKPLGQDTLALMNHNRAITLFILSILVLLPSIPRIRQAMEKPSRFYGVNRAISSLTTSNTYDFLDAISLNDLLNLTDGNYLLLGFSEPVSKSGVLKVSVDKQGSSVYGWMQSAAGNSSYGNSSKCLRAWLRSRDYIEIHTMDSLGVSNIQKLVDEDPPFEKFYIVSQSDISLEQLSNCTDAFYMADIFSASLAWDLNTGMNALNKLSQSSNTCRAAFAQDLLAEINARKEEAYANVSELKNLYWNNQPENCMDFLAESEFRRATSNWDLNGGINALNQLLDSQDICKRAFAKKFLLEDLRVRKEEAYRDADKVKDFYIESGAENCQDFMAESELHEATLAQDLNRGAEALKKLSNSNKECRANFAKVFIQALEKNGISSYQHINAVKNFFNNYHPCDLKLYSLDENI